MTRSQAYSVIDLFAGPGGLGEGFAAFVPEGEQEYAFRTVISIEKDEYAHRTLELRHFFRTFSPGKVPQDYYSYLEGKITRDALFNSHPDSRDHAGQTAWQCTLGATPHDEVRHRISTALGDQPRWVLVGGPPCQAYSRIGRSRMKNVADFDDDPRHFLYREYLRILADHKPPVFVMENVPGLLSATVGGEGIFESILHDLQNPEAAVYHTASGVRYRLYSLSQSGERDTDSDRLFFVVRAEDYGIPQARHRIFIIGIRDDLSVKPGTLTKLPRTSVQDFIGDLPRLRSSLSRQKDNHDAWIAAIREVLNQPWFRAGRLNGFSEETLEAEKQLKIMSGMRLEASDRTYSPSAQLPTWIRDDSLTVLHSHEARSHMTPDLHRYFFATLYAITKGHTPKLRHFPDALLPDHRNVEKGKEAYFFADRFRVQLADSPSTTITSHIAKDGHYYIHYDPAQCRSLTVREAARLQTFPDNYKFEGNRTAQYHQVGNAAPPLLAS